MRQSTPGNNLKHLIKEELVKRFESVVREEIQRYENSISENNKQFYLINARLDEFCDHEKRVCALLEKLRIDCKNDVVTEKKDLFEKFEAQRRHVNEKVKSIESLTNDLFKQSASFVDKQDLLDEVSILQSQMINIGLNAEKQKKHLCECIHEIKEDLIDLINDFQNHTSKRLAEIQEQINTINESNKSNKIDSSGILKELQVYKKSVFIIEKNIENIYKLIDRIQKGV